ncbi:Transcriptional activator ptaB [Penicillium chermesinum]|uniref:Transcriptional activator ptaB n=1 Tax=Penicillium chermesinum TaxID=63820 RepID=A0A9W9NTQ8_9EURO|nr:Transcriptional activator ptaB [Penicillium chermesinum]KAJ5226032.1 Transcriptional activator ptaB [Penicillium chermesinum]
MAQPFPGGQGMPQHGMPPGHHPMPQHPNAGHPGPSMVQGMHPGVSAPGGPQVSQAGPMMGGMPPGAAGSVGPGGPMPSSHALSHLNPAQAHVFQQGGFPQNWNPQLMQQQQYMRQRMMIQQQQAQQQHQQQHGLPVSLPNGTQGLNAAQLAAMQGNGMRPMNPMMQQQQFPHGPPQNIQQQQQLFALQQAQAQAQAQQAQAQQNQANNGQPGQQTPQRASAQPPNMHEAQTGTPQSQHGPPQSSTPQPSQTSQPPSSQPPQPGVGAPAQATPNPQPQQLPQSQPQQHQQQGNQGGQQQSQQAAPGPQSQPNAQNFQVMAAQDAQMKAQQNAMMMKMQQPQRQGASILALNSYADGVGVFTPRNEAMDIQYWQSFVDRFYAPTGVLRQNLYDSQTGHSKQFEISNPALARFYYTQFTTGIRQIQMVFTRGKLHALFDMNNKIESMQIEVQGHCEFLPRSIVQSLEANELKQSPKVSKAAAKRGQKPPQSPIPESMVTSNGVPTGVVQFLEVAETMHQMQQLVSFSQANPTLSPPEALRGLVNSIMQNPNPQPGFPPGMNPAMQVGPRGPNMGPPSQFASPAMAHLGLPQGSPHLSGSAHPSPAQSQLSGAPGMPGSVQPSPAGINNSPNVGGNKRRRASTVKQEGEDGAGGEVNGTSAPGGKPKPSPRVPKRQKGAPA